MKSRSNTKKAYGKAVVLTSGGLLLSTLTDADAAIVYSGNVVDGTFGPGSGAHLYVDFGLGIGNIAGLGGGETASGGSSFAFFPGGHSFEGVVGSNSSVSMLATSKNVKTQTQWYSSGPFFVSGGTVNKGAWDSENKTGYMGFQFNNSGTINYGWMEIQRNGAAKDSGILLRWAFEDEGKDIRVGDTGQGGSAVPEPSGLALLALGAAGIYALRKKRRP